MQVTVFIADEQRMFVESLSEVINRMNGLEVTDTACSGREVLEKMTYKPCDVVVVGGRLASTDGLPVAGLIRQRFPRMKVVLLIDREAALIKKVLKMEALGYLLKTDGKEDLYEAIRTVTAGTTYFSQSITDTLARQYMEKSHETKKEMAAVPAATLTERETEIVSLVAQEYSSIAIAEKLFISPKTVNTHRRNLMKKLKVKNALGLIRYAISHGLINQ